MRRLVLWMLRLLLLMRGVWLILGVLLVLILLVPMLWLLLLLLLLRMLLWRSAFRLIRLKGRTLASRRRLPWARRRHVVAAHVSPLRHGTRKMK